MCERALETEQNCNILTPHSIGHNRFSFPFSWAAQPGAWGPDSLFSVGLFSNWLIGAWGLPLLGAGFLYRTLSPTDWISWYIIVQRPPFSCGRHNFALIQPAHGQGHNILIFLDRMHLLFTRGHFLFWQPGRVVGQYTTIIRGQERVRVKT